MGRIKEGFVDSWKMEPLSMAVLAGITPDTHEVSFYDDRVERLDYDKPADLVAIAVETYTARRAYQIAYHYRLRGAKVVMGGFHATLMPKEVQAHADAVVVGEAEPVWSELLQDAEAGRLKPLYRGEQRPCLGNLKLDRSIFKGKNYVPLTLVETGRGCNFACDFCAVTAYYDRSYRYRPPAHVAAEIAEGGRKRVFLVDDNLSADPGRLKTLLREIAPLNVRWMSQATIKTADDPEVVRLLQKSGCEAILIGFESLGEATLKSMKKGFNRGQPNYTDNLKRLRDAGIKVYATFVFGYDTDTPDVFERTLEFAMQQRFFVAAFNHLQPFPGTPLYKRMEEAGRMLYPKWWLQPGYNFGEICFQPTTMSPGELYERLATIRRTFYSKRSIALRSLDFKANFNSAHGAWTHLWVNSILRRELNQKWKTPLGDLSEAFWPETAKTLAKVAA